MAETFSAEAVERKRRAWDWLFDSPFSIETNPARVLMVMRKGRLVGGVILYPVEFTLDGQPTPTVLPIGNNIRPDDRGAGLATLRTCLKLGHGGLTVGLANSDRLSAVWAKLGAVTSRSRTLRQKVYRAGDMLAHRKPVLRRLAPVIDRVFRLPLAATGLLRPRRTSGERIVSVDRFGPEFDRAWEAARASVVFALSRTAAYLQWRHIDSPFPGDRCLALFRGDAVAGYVVLTLTDTPGGRVGRVVDFFAHSGSVRDYGLLLAAADRVFAREGCTYGEVAFGYSKVIAAAARRNGFLIRKETRSIILTHENPVIREQLPRLLQSFHFCRSDHDEDF